MNYNQILKLFTILSVCTHEIISQPVTDQDVPIFHRNMETTAQCKTEIDALGTLGDYANFDPSAMLTSECDISMQNGLNVKCDFKAEDNFQECMDAGGQHHLMTLDLKCDTVGLNVKNFALCVGASCDLENIKEVAKPELGLAIQAAVAGFGQQIDPEQCTTTFEATKSTPARSSDDVGTNGDTEGDGESIDSGSTRHITWTSIIIMAAALILFVV